MSDKEYYFSTNEEYFNADSVDELDLEDGDTYYRCERQDIKGSALVSLYSAETVVEGMNEMLYDEAGECALDRLDVSDEATEELHQLLRDWADKHAKIHCWKAVNIENLTYTAAKRQEGE